MLQPKKRSRRCRFFLPPPTSSSRFSLFIVIFHTVSSCNAASCTLILQRSGEPNKPKCLAASTKPAAEAAEPRCYRPSAGDNVGQLLAGRWEHFARKITENGALWRWLILILAVPQTLPNPAVLGPIVALVRLPKAQRRAAAGRARSRRRCQGCQGTSMVCSVAIRGAASTRGIALCLAE
ncbi:hypothetical protein TGAM01_v205055 [Trichoderma gamsii]|uniref:Uncharacterized protein n=1 Tax=Trichoderma gamsii TaxID=398673 RepID=A0A2P4ZPB2_9HYPO|nr:hypothetical protein TGAM01_v205055 [Trichoderma gamsii]PON26111.1 hypothetical protein TGAM01_v205055 [Trichoderma gamsii]